jgi:hypothetical protein
MFGYATSRERPKERSISAAETWAKRLDLPGDLLVAKSEDEGLSGAAAPSAVTSLAAAIVAVVAMSSAYFFY